MAFIIFFFFLKKFEKVEKTGFFRAKFLLHCTLSFILGVVHMKLYVLTPIIDIRINLNYNFTLTVIVHLI